MNTVRYRRWPVPMSAAAAALLVSCGAFAQTPPGVSGRTTGTEDIRDIRGPRTMATEWLIPGLLAAAVVGLGASAAISSWRRRQRRQEQTPREIALEQLEVARALVREGRSREFSIAVSGIVRRYVEDTYRIVATHQTTDEFLHQFAQSSDRSLADKQDLMGEFLKSCDLAKFGGWNLTVAEMLAMFDGARRFIAESGRPNNTNGLGRAGAQNTSRETYDSLAPT